MSADDVLAGFTGWRETVAEWIAAAEVAAPVRWKNLDAVRARLQQSAAPPLQMMTSDGRTTDQVAAEARRCSQAVTAAVQETLAGARFEVLDNGVVVCTLANGRIMLGFDGCSGPPPAAGGAPGADNGSDEPARRR